MLRDKLLRQALILVPVVAVLVYARGLVAILLGALLLLYAAVGVGLFVWGLFQPSYTVNVPRPSTNTHFRLRRRQRP